MTVSAALIARNEELSLPRCLASLTGQVDEIIVVDTGSTDRTVEIANEAGATVSHFEWCDDFSAARNHALAMVNSDWILSIDADEELVGNVRECLSGDIVRLAIVDIPTFSKVAAPRLFRIKPGIHWTSPIHEYMVTSGELRDCPARLNHYGYTEKAKPEKLARNIAILERADPNPHILFHLARELLLAGRYEDALTRGLELLELDLEGSQAEDAYAIAAWCAAASQDWKTGAAITTQARQNGAPSITTEYVRANCYRHLSSPSKAVEAAHRACQMQIPTESKFVMEEVWTARRYELLRELS